MDKKKERNGGSRFLEKLEQTRRIIYEAESLYFDRNTYLALKWYTYSVLATLCTLAHSPKVRETKLNNEGAI